MMLARSTPARKTELDRIARQLDGLERQATALGAHELAYVVELARIAALQELAFAEPANENRLGGPKGPSESASLSRPRMPNGNERKDSGVKRLCRPLF